MIGLRKTRQEHWRRGRMGMRVLLLAVFCGAGCSQFHHSAAVQPSTPPMIGAHHAPTQSGIQQVGHTERPTAQATEISVAEVAHKTLPINLDTVLRLALDQNGDLLLAREKLNEAFAREGIARKAWLPDLYLGVSYFRHEGGIQDQDGKFLRSSFGSLFSGLEINGELDLREAVFRRIDAERRVWQRRGELSKLNSETLLDAANTYIALLAAKSGEAISNDIGKKLKSVLEQTKKLAATEPGVQVEVHRVEAQLQAQKQITRELQSGARSATAKLIHLLGLDPHAELVVMDPKLVPFQLIPPHTPVDHLVQRALTSGPGIRELQGLLALIHSRDSQSSGLGRFLPVFEVRMAEGAFGAGPNSSSTWDNRWDLAVQARWNLKNLVTAQDSQWAAQAQINQAHLGYKNLQSKLTLGVREAVESSASNAEQIQFAEKQIQEALKAYKLSQHRLDNNIPGSSPSEVLLAIRSLAGAQLAYIDALRNFDQAQLRLLVLTGMGPGACPQ